MAHLHRMHMSNGFETVILIYPFIYFISLFYWKKFEIFKHFWNMQDSWKEICLWSH